MNAVTTGGTVILLPGTYPENVTMITPSNLSVVPGTATISGDISGIPGLTKAGSGTLVLSGTNSYLGNTTINRGTLQISNDNQLGSPLAFVAVTTPGMLEIAGDG